jgi:hypothetical protein
MFTAEPAFPFRCQSVFPKLENTPMDAASSGHPTRQVLNSFGLGKLSAAFAGIVEEHLEIR